MSRGKIDPIFPSSKLVPISSGFLAWFATFGIEVCQSVLLFCPREGIPHHARLIGCAGVAGDFVEAFVAAEGGDFVGATACLS